MQTASTDLGISLYTILQNEQRPIPIAHLIDYYLPLAKLEYYLLCTKMKMFLVYYLMAPSHQKYFSSDGHRMAIGQNGFLYNTIQHSHTSDAERMEIRFRDN